MIFMHPWIRHIFRPLYRCAARNPLAQQFLRKELQALGANSWSAGIIYAFIQGDCGAAYGVTPEEKKAWVEAFQRNTQAIESGTAPIVHVLLAQEILSIPPAVEGSVVECGVWKGASTASLSLICRRVGRRLKVCDSFQGLPDDETRLHKGMHSRVYGYYQQGMFCGPLEEVRENLRNFGALEVCDFIPGFFSESLNALDGPVAFAFLDVDLESSTRDCLRALWPRLVEQGAIYSDDAGDLDVVRVYFDEPWWREQFGIDAPGFVGSGCGLPLSPSYSSLGYTRKILAFRETDWRKAPFLHYPDPPNT